MIKHLIVHVTFALIQLGSMSMIFVLPFTRFYWITLAYFPWIYIDRNTSKEVFFENFTILFPPFTQNKLIFVFHLIQGGRASESFRNAYIWKLFTGYFPVNLIKTADLDPTKNYLLGIHPHG
jgi:hypothetical protein